MVATTSSTSWPPSTSMNYVSEHTDSDNINKKSEQFEPGINPFANDCKIIYKVVLLVILCSLYS